MGTSCACCRSILLKAADTAREACAFENVSVRRRKKKKFSSIFFLLSVWAEFSYFAFTSHFFFLLPSNEWKSLSDAAVCRFSLALDASERAVNSTQRAFFRCLLFTSNIIFCLFIKSLFIWTRKKPSQETVNNQLLSESVGLFSSSLRARLLFLVCLKELIEAN